MKAKLFLGPQASGKTTLLKQAIMGCYVLNIICNSSPELEQDVLSMLQNRKDIEAIVLEEVQQCHFTAIQKLVDNPVVPPIYMTSQLTQDEAAALKNVEVVYVHPDVNGFEHLIK